MSFIDTTKREAMKSIRRGLAKGESALKREGSEISSGRYTETELRDKINALEISLGTTFAPKTKDRLLKLAKIINSKGLRLSAAGLVNTAALLLKLVKKGVELGDKADRRLQSGRDRRGGG